jgi:hypothetical protein
MTKYKFNYLDYLIIMLVDIELIPYQYEKYNLTPPKRLKQGVYLDDINFTHAIKTPHEDFWIFEEQHKAWEEAKRILEERGRDILFANHPVHNIVKKYRKFHGSSYGICDSMKQFWRKFGRWLRRDSRHFCVCFTPTQKETAGWRWYKMGPYIGKYKSMSEYYHNDPEIPDTLWFYHIYLIKENRKNET